MERPYRSHLQPACLACRRRKSRCRLEVASVKCLMCQVHGTICDFPPAKHQNNKGTLGHYECGDRPRYLHTAQIGRKRRPPSQSHGNTKAQSHPTQARTIDNSKTASRTTVPALASVQHHPSTALSRDHAGERRLVTDAQEEPSIPTKTGIDTQMETPHIVGPMATNDENTLRQYLDNRSSKNGVQSNSTEDRAPNPVLFRTISKRPVGVSLQQSPGRKQLQIIEKLIEPHAERLIDLFFGYLNDCFPVLDESSFKNHRCLGSNEAISPALMSCIFAHAMILWPHTLGEEGHRCPDTRFIWVQAEDAIRAELRLSPGLSTVVGILLDVGGRPTTSMLGNAINIGAVVSLCHALGLNRNPLIWSIPEGEKSLRIRLWWSLVIHDHWYSLAYGTPPHIHRSQYDVPLPRTHPDVNDSMLRGNSACEIFYYLSTLTEILGECLEYVYRLDKTHGSPFNENTHIEKLQMQLESWEKSVNAGIRHAVLQDTKHELQGGANLRLAYLSVKMHIQRIALDKRRSGEAIDSQDTAKPRDLAQEAAAQIVAFVESLERVHIYGFWHPVSSFSLASACTLLIRCAIESHDSESHRLYESKGVTKANELIVALKAYKETYAWDIGDICISQCEKVVEELMNRDSEINGEEQPGTIDDIEFGALIAEELFPSVWDLVDMDYENGFHTM